MAGGLLAPDDKRRAAAAEWAKLCRSAAALVAGIGVSTLLWFDWSNRFVWVVMLVTFGFGAIGWVDDYRKVVADSAG